MDRTTSFSLRLRTRNHHLTTPIKFISFSFLYSFKSSVFAAEAMVPRSRVIIDTDPVVFLDKSVHVNVGTHC